MRVPGLRGEVRLPKDGVRPPHDRSTATSAIVSPAAPVRPRRLLVRVAVEAPITICAKEAIAAAPSAHASTTATGNCEATTAIVTLVVCRLLEVRPSA